MFRFILSQVFICLLVSQDLKVSGNLIYTEAFGDPIYLNSNTQEDNPFHRLRSRLFFNSSFSENIHMEIEIAFDDFAQERRWIWLHGAFISIENIVDDHQVNFKIGKLPLAVGKFPSRVNEADNFFISLPLAYHYRTLVDWNKVWDPNSQVILRLKRQTDGYIPHSQYPSASVIAYEAIWDYGLNINGLLGNFEYTLQLTNGSVTNPEKNYQNKDGKDRQISGRIAYQISDWFSFGLSSSISRYLNFSDNLPPEEVKENFYHKIYAGDFSIELQNFKFFSEFWISRWDNIINQEFLEAKNLSLEAVYLVNGLADLEFALRYEKLQFNQITEEYFDPNDSASPQKYRKTWWDSDLNRYEIALNYSLNRQLKLKSQFQYWEYEQYKHSAISSIQLLFSF